MLKVFRVIVSAIAFHIVGALWYSPVVFGPVWMSSVGTTPEQVLAMGAFPHLFALAGAFIFVLIVDRIIQKLKPESFKSISVWVVLLWAGFFLSTSVSHYMFLKLPTLVLVLDILHTFLAMILATAVLYFWNPRSA